jgi:T-complex protein 1 subunit theta
MAFHVPRGGLQQMMKKGTRYMEGKEEVVYDSISTIKELGDTTKTAYGPFGMNKIVQNHIEKLFLTSDAATMIKELDIRHPAAKMVVMAAHQQEEETGDGTNGCVMLCSSILHESEYLLRMGLAVPELVSGLQAGLQKGLSEMNELVSHTVDLQQIRDVNAVKYALKASLMSKQLGNEEFLSNIIAEACVSTLPKDAIRFNVDDIRVCKIMGSNLAASKIIPGMVFKRYVDSEIQNVIDAKVAMFNCPLDNLQTETKGTVLLKNADELKNFTKTEEQQLYNAVKAIAESGAKVVVCGGKISDLGLDYANKMGLMTVRLNSKWDMRRLAKTIGATVLPRLTPPSADEMGFCDKVRVEEIGDTRVVSFQRSTSRIATIVLRAGTTNVLDDLERAVDDGVNNFKLLTKDKRLVAGAGAFEVELSRRLDSFSEQCLGMEQYGIKLLAKAYEYLPRQLAENCGQNPSKVISKLLAAHSAVEGMTIGVNIESEELQDAAQNGIFDHILIKEWQMKLAVNTAITILRVNQIIMAKRAGGPKAPSQRGGHWDDDHDEED